MNSSYLSPSLPKLSSERLKLNTIQREKETTNSTFDKTKTGKSIKILPRKFIQTFN